MMTRGTGVRSPVGVLNHRAELPYSIDLPVLGIMTRFETNSRDVYDLVAEKFGPWSTPAMDCPALDAPRAHVRVLVHEATEHGAGRAPVQHVCPDDRRMIAHSPGSFAICDPARSEVYARVTTELVADREHFHDQVLQAMTLALLSSWDRHFVHAAAIARGDRALICSAASGTGKSTLAYLAYLSGLERVDQDAITEALCRDIAPGFDRHAAHHEPAARAIARRGGWRLRLSKNPHDALPHLLRMLED